MTLEPPATSQPVSHERRLAFAVLSRAAHTDPGLLTDLPDTVAVLEAAHRLTVDAGAEGRARAAQAERDLDSAARAGARLITREDPGWPTAKLAAPASAGARPAPIALWARGTGDLEALTRRSIVVTGARAATGYGTAVATEFTTELLRHDRTVVTGGGYGIDAAVHRAALAEAAPALLVTAAGIDRPYPHAHSELFDCVARTGLILAENPPGTTAHRCCFERRSALLAAFGECFVLIEAAPRGQATRTAVLAHLLGRPVFAVPGPITSAQSRGCHSLIAAGQATLTTCVTDILADTGTAL